MYGPDEPYVSFLPVGYEACTHLAHKAHKAHCSIFDTTLREMNHE